MIILASFLVLFFTPMRPDDANADPMALHDYDSSTQWRMTLEEAIEDLLNRLLAALQPVHGKVSSRFGTRYHPIKKIMRHHSGIDIACPEGSAVRVVLPGTVKYAGHQGGYGLVAIVEHSGNLTETRYAHLSELFVNSGDTIQRGEMIALSGSTGLATGPHLHFELYQSGKPIDPEKFMDLGAKD